jgi:hypothetical protein
MSSAGVSPVTPHLERVTTIRLPVDHFHDLFMHQLSRLISIAPVVTGSHAALANVEVLGIVNVPVRTRLYPVDNLSTS